MKRTTISATDKIGRKETITFLFDDSIAERLQKAADSQWSSLEYELNIMYDNFKYGYGNDLSRSQFIRLRDFYKLIYHKFYNYTLTVHIS